MSKHIVLDLETLGVTPGSVVFAIGAVYFDDADLTKTCKSVCYMSEYHAQISIFESTQNNFRIEPMTLDWWKGQSYQGELNLASRFSCPGPIDVINHFKKWYLRCKSDSADNPLVWGNGKEFDNALIRAYFDKLDIACPWTFREDMDFRTVRNLFPELKPTVDNRLPHNSLCDAVYEGKWLQNIIQAIKSSE